MYEYAPTMNYTILKHNFAKIIQIFCRKGWIRSRIRSRIRNDSFGFGSDLSRKFQIQTHINAAQNVKKKYFYFMAHWLQHAWAPGEPGREGGGAHAGAGHQEAHPRQGRHRPVQR